MSRRLPGVAAILGAAALLLTTTPVSAQSLVPSAPRNFRGSATGSTLTLSWDAPLSGAPIFYYVIELGQQPGVYDASVPVGPLTTVSADIDDGVYYFRVYAVNGDGPGPPSPEVAVAVGASTGQPGAPQNLTAGMVPDLLTLMWDAPAEGLPLTGYVLYVGRFPGTSDVLRLPIGSTTPTLSLPVGSIPAGTYFLRLTAVNAFGEGPASNEVSITLSNGPPSAPRNLVASLVNDVLTLTWEPPAVHPEGVNYVLLVSDRPGGFRIRVHVGSVLSYTRSLASESPGTIYLRMVAMNGFGESPPSNEVTLIWGPSPPGPPQAPVAALSGTSVTVSWLPPATGEPFTNYTVHLSDYPGASTFRFSTGGATSLTLPLAGAAPGLYYFHITAWNAFGEGPRSEIASVTIGSGDPPPAPSLLEAVVESGVLWLHWYPPLTGRVPLTRQVLYVGTAPGASDVLQQPLEAAAESFSVGVTGATPGIYYLRVRAANVFGEGPPSNEISVVIGPYCAVPAAPVLTGSAAGSTVSLAWTTPLGGPVTGYTLFVAPGPGQPFTEFGSVGPVNAVSGPASPGTYDVRITAEAACGRGPHSNTVTITVP